VRRQAIVFSAIVVVVALVVVLLTRVIDDDPAPALAAGPPRPVFQASVDVDPTQGGARLSWRLDPSLQPTPSTGVIGYQVVVAVDDRPITAAPAEVLDPFLDADLWAGFGRWDADVPFVASVRAQYRDGTLSPWFSQDLVLPAVVPWGDAWEVGAPETLVDDPGTAYGLDMWIDGSIGFAPVDGGVRAFAPNGPTTASWRVDDRAFVAGVDRADLTIAGQDADYAAGGPVYVHTGEPADPADDRLVLFYHGEDHRHATADPTRWWGFLGMAVSSDGGETFLDAGPIVAPNLPVTEPPDAGVEVGGGPYAIVEDDGVTYVYVYFRDTLASGEAVKLGVARAPLASVVGAAEACTPAVPEECEAPSFVKFDGASWGEPGARAAGTSGGAPADLFAPLGITPTPVWFDVVELSSRNLFVLVFSWYVPSDVPARQDIDGWSTAVSVSTDGLDWSRPVRIVETEPRDELAYVTATGPDLRRPRVTAGDDLVLYRTRTEYSEPGPPGRWSGAVAVERLDLRYRP
jgi:hypothetical protein